LGLFSYAAAQGYMRARLPRLLSPIAWARLTDAASGADLNRLLSGTAIARFLVGDGRIQLPRLRGEIARAERAVARFLPRRSRELVQWYNRRFEIENLKTVLRAVHFRLEPARALTSLIPIQPSPQRWEALIQTDSVPALIDRLAESPFIRPLQFALERYQEERRLFYLEIALDLFYFQKLVRLIEALSGRDAQDVRRSLGRWIAVQNLLWAYRYRLYGRMTPEEIVNFTLHRAFLGGLETVRRVALGSPLSTEAARLGFSLPPELPELDALTRIEFLAQRERFRQAAAILSKSLFYLDAVLAYSWLLESEARDLAVVVEGKGAGLSGAQIAARLVRTQYVRT
jgi:V/A-type H+/Na+-transporting ATPase subunit C